MSKKTVDELLAAGCEAGEMPAVAAVVVNMKEQLAASAVGKRRLSQATPIQLDDAFHIGSNAKAMSASVCGSLSEQGKLTWETRLFDCLPMLEASSHTAYQDVTLAQLFRHRAGIQPYTEMEQLEPVLGRFEGTPREQRLQFAAHVLAEAPVAAPGASASYSNAGVSIAAAMAEAVGDSSWEAQMQAHVFNPLGLTTAGIGWPADNNPNAPWGHMKDDENDPMTEHDPAGEYRLPPLLRPAGDVFLSMPDYGRFLQAHLQGLNGQDSAWSSETIRRMHTPPEGGIEGLGWGVQPFGDDIVSAHVGGAGTFVAVGIVHHQKELAIGVAANAGHGKAEKTCIGLIKQLLAEFS